MNGDTYGFLKYGLTLIAVRYNYRNAYDSYIDTHNWALECAVETYIKQYLWGLWLSKQIKLSHIHTHTYY